MAVYNKNSHTRIYDSEISLSMLIYDKAVPVIRVKVLSTDLIPTDPDPAYHSSVCNVLETSLESFYCQKGRSHFSADFYEFT